MSWFSDNAQGIGTVGGAVIGGLLGGAGGIVAGAGVGNGLGSQLGGYDQNAANKDAADTAYKRNIEQETIAYERNQASAREQMAFQERMRNTSHQAEVEDLKKAGLNPILSANGGAAMAPGAGASASAAQAVAPKMENQDRPNIATALSLVSAVQAAQMQKEQIANLRSQTDKNNIDTAVKRKDLPEAEAKYGAWTWLKQKFNESWNSNAVKENLKKPVGKPNNNVYSDNPALMQY